MESDDRECGFLGCGHDLCEPFCVGIHEDGWLEQELRKAEHEAN